MKRFSLHFISTLKKRKPHFLSVMIFCPQAECRLPPIRTFFHPFSANGRPAGYDGVSGCDPAGGSVKPPNNITKF